MASIEHPNGFSTLGYPHFLRREWLLDDSVLYRHLGCVS